MKNKFNIPLIIGFEDNLTYNSIEHYNNMHYIVKRRFILKNYENENSNLFGIEISMPLESISEEYVKKLRHLS